MERIPKSTKERMRLYRERIRSNPELYELYKKRDRDRKRKTLDNMNEQERNTKRKKQREATRLWRSRSKDAQENTNEDGHGYTTPASLGKAMARAKRGLPLSPMKQAVVVQKLAENIKLRVKLPSHPSHHSALPEETVHTVKAFFENDSISRVSPGKADFCTIKGDDGQKRQIRKRHMVMTISEAYSLFKEEHPDVVIGKSKFAELRPVHVLIVSKMPHNVCGCKYHNNIILLMESLHRKIPEMIPLYSREELFKLCVCNTESEECLSGLCEECEDTLFHVNVINKVDNSTLKEKIKWFQWMEDEDGYLVKSPLSGTLHEALNSMNAQLPKFIWHSFIKERQARSYEVDKLEATDEKANTCVLQVDFAENFTVVFQDEVASAHWKRHQVSLFTSQWNHRGRIHNLVLASDFLSHEKKSISAYMYYLVKKILAEIPTVKTIKIWSDGPSSQFKNRYIFCLCAIFLSRGFHIIWNYFATSHGKGPTDALGGNAKRIVERKIRGRQVNVKDAATFVQALNGSNINVKLISKEEIDATCDELNLLEQWKKVPPVPGTINTHCVSATDATHVECKFFTSSETGQIRSVGSAVSYAMDHSDEDDIPLNVLREF